MKKVISGFLTHTQYSWQTPEESSWGFQAGASMEDSQYTVQVQPVEFTVDIPENFSPIAQKIAALQVTADKLKKSAFEELRKIDDEIAKLSCLEYVAATTKEFDDAPF